MSIVDVNIEICETLRQEYNEVIYKAWLAFIENAQLKNGNIVISVPNQYIKETFLDRYAFDIEKLYKNCFNFDKLIVEIPAEEAKSYPLILSNTEMDILEIVDSCIKDIYVFIENAKNSGMSNVSCEILKDSTIMDELYFRIKDFLLNKGFKTELLTTNNNYTLSLSW
jgi:chromosomal replication initiation ATPase DnaA